MPPPSPLLLLPHDILRYLASRFLDLSDHKALASTCRYLRRSCPIFCDTRHAHILAWVHLKKPKLTTIPEKVHLHQKYAVVLPPPLSSITHLKTSAPRLDIRGESPSLVMLRAKIDYRKPTSIHSLPNLVYLHLYNDVIDHQTMRVDLDLPKLEVLLIDSYDLKLEGNWNTPNLQTLAFRGKIDLSRTTANPISLKRIVLTSYLVWAFVLPEWCREIPREFMKNTRHLIPF